MTRRHWFGPLLAMVFAASALAVDAPLSPEQDARYRAMINELRCLVCQNQTIADSSAPLALDLREQVHQRIESGESDQDIRRYLTDRYGDFVLYDPPLKAKTLVLWIGPFALLLLALITALIYMRRSRERVPSAPADPAALKRLLDDEEGRS